MLEWARIDPDEVYVDEEDQLVVHRAVIDLSANADELAEAFAEVFEVLTLSARHAGPTFGCWHCHTTIEWQPPRCMRCGAHPGPQGWPRMTR